MTTEWYKCGIKTDDKKNEFLDCLGPFHNALQADNYYQHNLEKPTLISVWTHVPKFLKTYCLKETYNNLFNQKKVFITKPI